MIFVPTGQAPHKEIEDDPGGETRLAMTRLAAAEDPRFETSPAEIERRGPSYAYETLEELAEQEGDTELLFLMGADAALGLESWREPHRIAQLARVAVAGRAGVDQEDVEAVLDRVGAREGATMLEMPPFAVSSSAVRARAAAGRPLRFLVSDPVAEFIEREELYR